MGGDGRHGEFQGTETVRPYRSPRPPGPRQARRTITTIIMSAATFCSLLNITDSCCEPTWLTIWLFWGRIADNILMWLMAGSRMNKTMKNNRRMYRTASGRKKWSKIVTKSQAVAVMNAAFFATVEKRKMCYSFPSSISSANMTKSWTRKINTVWLTLDRKQEQKQKQNK